MSTVAEAERIHRECVVIDGHNDHVDLKNRRGDPLNFMKVNRGYHSDGTRLLRGDATASIFMVGGDELKRSLAMMGQTLAETERHPDSLMLVTRSNDIRRAKRTRRLGVMLSWETCTALQHEMDILYAVYRLGLRAATVTHGEGGTKYSLQGTQSYFGYCTEDERATMRRSAKGLTAFGRAAVVEMNQLGILVDVAHANDATVEDIIELTTKPVVSTHGGVYACTPHSRCSTDEQIRAIAATGGLLSITFHQWFIGDPQRKATVQGIVDQIEYVAALVGIDHVGIGSDFDGMSEGLQPIIGPADQLRKLTRAMLARGLTAREIQKVWGANYLRVLKETID